jgi:hypothetical protein
MLGAGCLKLPAARLQPPRKRAQTVHVSQCSLALQQWLRSASIMDSLVSFVTHS